MSDVVVRCIDRDDRWWLLGVGFDPRKIGEQYHWAETPLQVFNAPARALLGPRRAAVIIESNERRAGYVGPNPLSGNLEYFVQPWARGSGLGSRAIAAYLRDHRSGDRPRRFYIAKHNERSYRAVRRAFADIGWVEGTQFTVDDAGRNWWVQVPAG